MPVNADTMVSTAAAGADTLAMEVAKLDSARGGKIYAYEDSHRCRYSGRLCMLLSILMARFLNFSLIMEKLNKKENLETISF